MKTKPTLKILLFARASQKNQVSDQNLFESRYQQIKLYVLCKCCSLTLLLPWGQDHIGLINNCINILDRIFSSFEELLHKKKTTVYLCERLLIKSTRHHKQLRAK